MFLNRLARSKEKLRRQLTRSSRNHPCVEKSPGFICEAQVAVLLEKNGLVPLAQRHRLQLLGD